MLLPGLLQMYMAKATVNNGEDKWIQGWLEGFINDVGSEEAKRLLGQRYLHDSTEATTDTA